MVEKNVSIFLSRKASKRRNPLLACPLSRESEEMHRAFVRSKTLISVASNRISSSGPTSLNPWQPLYLYRQKQQEASHSSSCNSGNTPFGSPTRVQKLIASQSDPLLAKEIFDLASRQPKFRHTYSSYLILLLKLGRSKHFSLLDDLLRRLKFDSHPITPPFHSHSLCFL